MNTVRLNITLPEEVGRILSKVKNNSAYIAEAIKEKKRMDDKERMKRELAAAYRQAAEEDYEAYMEWEDTLKDGLLPNLDSPPLMGEGTGGRDVKC